jgi:hypothetical protein
VPSVWGELGYDRIVHDIAQSLEHTSDIVVIEGPPGVGKSWLAQGVAAIWEREGGGSLVAEGDALRSEVAFYPLGFALAPLSSIWRSAVAPIATTVRAGESLAGTAGILSGAVGAIARLRPSRVRARALFLGDIEQEILFDLDSHAKRRPLLLVADNLHWWDAASLEFLERLRSRSLQDSYPFLAGLRVVAAQTVEPYQHVTSPAAHSALLDPATTYRIAVPRVADEHFAAILEGLGAPPDRARAKARAIHALTGGHLALARRCASRLADGETELFDRATDVAEFTDRLLGERIRALGALGGDAVEILQIAAILGLRFRRDEVTCARGGLLVDTSRLLRYLRDQDLIELSDDLGWFVHDFFRQHFLADGTFDRTSVHERLSDCLRRLRPGDYELRCENATMAEQTRDAARLGVQAALARRRDGHAVESLPQHVRDAIERGGLAAVTEQLVSALDHVQHDRYDACLERLASIPHALPRELGAEADYIRATCLMTTRSDDDRGRGRALLENWVGLEEDEPELGVRLLQLFLFGLTMVVDKAEGRAVERRLLEALRKRAPFDKSAEDAMYVLDRCASSLYEPDHALVRIREAVTHFRPSEDGEVVRRPVEYYRCLTNLAAELVVNGRYEEARSISVELERLVADHSPGLFPRLDHARTTALLAEYRLGAVEAAAAAAHQQIIVDRDGADNDPFYAMNALAVYRCLAGDESDAAAIYSKLLMRLESRNNPEPSMLYLLRANLAAVRFVRGEAGVTDEWASLSHVLARVPYPFVRFLHRRHDLLATVIERGEPMSAAEFDTCLTSGSPELGPMWDQLGRGFRMPEVEWWH